MKHHPFPHFRQASPVRGQAVRFASDNAVPSSLSAGMVFGTSAKNPPDFRWGKSAKNHQWTGGFEDTANWPKELGKNPMEMVIVCYSYPSGSSLYGRCTHCSRIWIPRWSVGITCQKIFPGQINIKNELGYNPTMNNYGHISTCQWNCTSKLVT